MSGCHYPYISICKHDIDPRVQECCHCEIEKKVELLSKRIEKLEKLCDSKMLEVMGRCIIQLEKMDNSSKQPHKCPVCDGVGKEKDYQITMDGILMGDKYSHTNCNSCDGKGVIWG